MMADQLRLRKCDVQFAIVTRKKPGHFWSGFNFAVFEAGLTQLSGPHIESNDLCRCRQLPLTGQRG